MTASEIEQLKKLIMQKSNLTDEELESADMSLAVLAIYEEPEMYSIIENQEAFTFFISVIKNCSNLIALKKQLSDFKFYSIELMKHKDMLELLTYYMPKYNINLPILISYLNVPEIKEDLILRLDNSIFIPAIFANSDIYDISRVSFFRLFDDITDLEHISNEKLYYYDNDIFPENEFTAEGLKYIFKQDLERKIVQRVYEALCHAEQKEPDTDYIENTLSNHEIVSMLLPNAIAYLHQNEEELLYTIVDELMLFESQIVDSSLKNKKALK